MAATSMSAPPVAAAPSLKERLAMWVLAFAFYAACTPRMLDYLKPPTGDEVFYLITAQSILYDHDLDETNQFRERSWLAVYPTCAEFRQRDWKGFSPPGIPCPGLGFLGPERTHAKVPGIYTKHGLGLSFLIVPAYALGKRVAVVFFLNGLAALLALNVYLLAWEACGQRRVARFCWAALGFGAPIFSYAYLIFPQPVCALCILYAYRRARLTALARLAAAPGHAPTPANSTLQMMAVAVCLGMLPWLHHLYVLLAAPLGAYLYLGGRRRTPEGTVLAPRLALKATAGLPGHVALGLMIAGLAAVYLARLVYLYGVPWPPPEDHAPFNSPSMLPVGFFGLLFDQRYGLLMYNPVYLIPIAWLVRLALARQQLSAVWRSELVWLLALIAPYYVLVADYSRWWGEWCPPARYLLPVAPLLVLPLARALVHAQSRFLTWYVWGAVVWTGALTAAFIVNPILSYNWQDPEPCKVLLWLENHYVFFKKMPLGNFFPSYVAFIKPLTPVFYVAHVAWLALAMWLGWRMMRKLAFGSEGVVQHGD
jgi:hypothetical protein